MAIETIDYLGLPNCRKITNGNVELIVTTDIGPRIIRYGFAGEENILGEHPEVVVETEMGAWKPFGGHRLWAAPEQKPRSYAPDNDPVHVRIEEDGTVRLTQNVDAAGIEKEIAVRLGDTGEVTIDHRITNRNIWGIELAPWALTIMNGGGVTILPQEPFRPSSEYLLPARAMALWHYTDLNDPRWNIGSRYIRLRTDSALHDPQKIGIMNKRGWGGYHRGGTLFIKRFAYREGARYPDYGCNNETYTAGDFMELETLAPLQFLEPGATAEHTEHWQLHAGIDLGDAEESIASIIEKIITD